MDTTNQRSYNYASNAPNIQMQLASTSYASIHHNEYELSIILNNHNIAVNKLNDAIKRRISSRITCNVSINIILLLILLFVTLYTKKLAKLI